MSSRWFWFLYPPSGGQLSPGAGLAAVGSGARLEYPGASVLPTEFDPLLAGTLGYEPLPDPAAARLQERLAGGEHLGVTLRVGLTRVELYSFHRARSAQVVFVFSTHESEEDQERVRGVLLSLAAAAGAAYAVVANERSELEAIFLRNESVPRLLLPGGPQARYGHGIHEVYVHPDLGGRTPPELAGLPGARTTGGYIRVRVPDAFTPSG